MVQGTSSGLQEEKQLAGLGCGSNMVVVYTILAFSLPRGASCSSGHCCTYTNMNQIEVLHVPLLHEGCLHRNESMYRFSTVLSWCS
jgi:hypothetical protein